jgi:hypothetical protein
VISEVDAKKEIAFFKKGGIFGGAGKRPGIIEMNEVY